MLNYLNVKVHFKTLLIYYYNYIIIFLSINFTDFNTFTFEWILIGSVSDSETITVKQKIISPIRINQVIYTVRAWCIFIWWISHTMGGVHILYEFIL